MSMQHHLVIMAAGTGGHIMPGLAIASEMQSRDWTVSWLGTTHGMENRLVPAQGIELDAVNFAGLRGKGLMGTVTGIFKLLGAFWSSWQILRKRRPHAVLGMGGYICYPAGKVAGWMGIPLILMNADADLLLSNRSLLSTASTICFGFDGPDVKTARSGVVTGNAVRSDIINIPVPLSRFSDREGPLKLLIVGGSLGAQALNEVLPKALVLIDPAGRPVVTHQTGEKNFEAVKHTYANAGITAEIVAFIDDMPERMKSCDLMICRSGAITVSELCTAGVASILVPFIASTTSHQVGNAKWLAEAGAAIHLPQSELSAEKLANLIKGLSRNELRAMASKARSKSVPDATDRIANQIEMLA